ncbi:hypothetical protein D3C85_531690 [compost metagenome]
MRFSRLFAAVLLVGMAGCTTMPAPETRHSGFLNDYSRLTKDPQWPKSEYWVKPSLEIKQSYQKRIYLEPPRLYVTGKDLDQTMKSPADTTAMLNYLKQAILYQFLTSGYEVTTRPEPDTLLLRTAITGSERTPRDPSTPEYLPIGMVVGGVMQLTGTRDESLRIYFESEMRDATSGELLAQSVSATTGNELSPSATTKVEDSYPALDAWARQLRERADKAFAQP